MEFPYSHYPDWRCRCLLLSCLSYFFELRFPLLTCCSIPMHPFVFFSKNGLLVVLKILTQASTVLFPNDILMNTYF